jgi:shikimate kinase
MNVVLIGFMGTGKSAIGKALALLLSGRFVDTDAEVEKTAGKTVAKVLSQDGAQVYRELELQLLRRLARERGPAVICTGGGTPLRAENCEMLEKIGPIVWLTAPTGTILNRVRQNMKDRPIHPSANQSESAEQRVRRLLAERNPVYRKAAHYEVDTSVFDDPEQAAGHIIDMLNMGEPTRSAPG